MTTPPTQFAIRPFQPADRPALVSLWARVFPDDPSRNAPQAMIDNKLCVQPELLLVGEASGELAGAVMAGYDGVRGWIYHLAVTPEQRSGGAGWPPSWCVPRRRACAGLAARRRICRFGRRTRTWSRSIAASATKWNSV